MAQAYKQGAMPAATVTTDSVQERIEHGMNIEEVQEAYVQMQTQYVK